jgi:hypothetical protein
MPRRRSSPHGATNPRRKRPETPPASTPKLDPDPTPNPNPNRTQNQNQNPTPNQPNPTPNQPYPTPTPSPTQPRPRPQPDRTHPKPKTHTQNPFPNPNQPKPKPHPNPNPTPTRSNLTQPRPRRLQRIVKELNKSCQHEDGSDDLSKGTQLLEARALPRARALYSYVEYNNIYFNKLTRLKTSNVKWRMYVGIFNHVILARCGGCEGGEGLGKSLLGGWGRGKELGRGSLGSAKNTPAHADKYIYAIRKKRIN